MQLGRSSVCTELGYCVPRRMVLIMVKIWNSFYDILIMRLPTILLTALYKESLSHNYIVVAPYWNNYVAKTYVPTYNIIICHESLTFSLLPNASETRCQIK